MTANYITQTLHGTPPRYLSHGDLPHTLKAIPFPWWPPPYPESWNPTWTPTVQHGPPRYLSHHNLPHTLKAGNQHGPQHGPPRYLSHGDLPHTLKARNQHGSQQNKTPLTQPRLSVRSPWAVACSKALNVACGFGLQPKPTWNPTDIENHKLILIIKEPFHSSPPMSSFYWQKVWHRQNLKNIKKESLSPGVGWGSIFWSMLRHSTLVFLRSSCVYGECFPQHAWVESGLVIFCIPSLQEPEN